MHSPIDSQASQEQSLTVELICDEQCVANAVQTRSAAPTGADILHASGRPATPEQLVMQILRRGGLESIRLEEGVLSRNRRKFRQPINVACPAPGRWGRPNSRVTSRHFDHGNASRTSRPDCSGLDEAD